MALVSLQTSRLMTKQSLSRALTFAMISLVLGPPEERDRNLNEIKKICETTSSR